MVYKFEELTILNQIKKILNKVLKTRFILSEKILSIDCGSGDVTSVVVAKVDKGAIKILSSDYRA